jgi:hypothetical protein
MSTETDEKEETNESELKPTITIAESQDGDGESADAKPTITIAERDGGE